MNILEQDRLGSCSIDSVNFLFLKHDGYPKVVSNYGGMFRGLVKEYNKCHEEHSPTPPPPIPRGTRLAPT